MQRIKFLIVVCTVFFASCSSEETPSLPSQSWADILVKIETRPPRLVPGMNEFIVIATRGQRKAAHNLIVSLRINEGRWVQAIQDGKVGAYRRALAVPNPAQDILFVRIEYDNREGILRFPLNQQKVRNENTEQQ